MKISFLIVIIAFFVNANAQVVFEHDYDSASTFSSGNPAVADQLELVKFEVSGERYVKICRHGKKISIYDLNHSLQRTIDYSAFPNASTANNYAIFLYFSESLFDSDNGIEFLYTTNGGSPYTGIYNDNGSLVFSDTAVPLIFVSFPSQQYPIYNTSQGTKMLLSYQNGHAKVFGLPGTLSTGIQNGNNQLVHAQGGAISNLYPNPSNGAVTLEYELPKDENTGEIVLYNQQGAEVKRYIVDDTFKDLLLDNTMLPVGTYYYQLQTSKGAVGTKKMVVVK